MARRRDRELFEELGLLDTSTPDNPYDVLGLSRGFAAETLKELGGEETLRLAATALYRVLAKRLHPDTGATNEERFRHVSEAANRIDQADKATLVKWSTQERTATQAAVKHAQEKHIELVRHFSEFFQETLELGNHPHHFSQLPWSQGLLLQRANGPHLLRQSAEGGVEIIRGTQGSIVKSAAFSISSFLSQHESFGIEPDTDIVAYVTSERATLLDTELRFLMDITGPVADYRRRRAAKSEHPFANDFWARAEDPVLVTTTTPTPGEKRPPSRMIIFPEQDKRSDSSAWHLPMEVVGTLQDPGLFTKIRHRGSPQAGALTSSKQQRANYFNMAAIPTRALSDIQPSYSPLLGGKGLLILYDPIDQIPIVTDVQVAGMIGHDSRRG